MSWPILNIRVQTEADVVRARQRAWQIAELLGFDRIERTRVATAVSELVRNSVTYANGGRVAFALSGESAPQSLEISIEDKGPGIERLEDILEGRFRSSTGMGVGLAGARRLMERFKLDTHPGRGTRIELGQTLPSTRLMQRSEIQSLVKRLPADVEPDAPALLRQQNQELLEAFDRLRRREEESERLRQELEDTNRGVVALYAELDARADQLREASELKSRFLSNMSHEFRTPLNSILALCRLLQDRVDGELTSEQERQVSYIRRSADDLLALVNDLLDIAKVESGRIEIQPEHFRIGDLFSALRALLRPLQQGRDVELHFEAHPDLPPLFTDERKLAQIVRNLVANALKFTVAGSVRVEASLGTDPRMLRLVVRDTGIGIPPEHFERIFEEFAQVRNPLQKKAGGTGLGLPLSRKLAELLGGSIRIESVVGEGSTFTVEIPLQLESPSAGADRTRRVLVVDDDETFRYVVGQAIRSVGAFEVVEARDGGEGLRVARQSKPDVLLLDLQLPDRDGIGILEDILADDELKHIPVIVASSLLSLAETPPDLPPGTLVLPKNSLSRDLLGKLLESASKRSDPVA